MIKQTGPTYILINDAEALDGTNKTDNLLNTAHSLNASISTHKSTQQQLKRTRASTLATIASVIQRKKVVIIAYITMILSAILFSFLAIIIQYGAILGYPSGELLMFRGIEQILIVILMIVFKKQYKKIKENIQTLSKIDIIWLILRGLFGSLAGLCYFLAIDILPVGDAIAVFSIYPICCLLFASFILKEEIKSIHFILLITSSIGVMLIAQPHFLSFMFNDKLSNDENVDSDYYIIPVIGAVFAGMAFISLRKSKNTNPQLLIASYSIFSCFSGAISVIIYYKLKVFDNHVLFKFVAFNDWYHIKQWLVLLSLGIIGYLAQITMTLSAQKLEAGVSSFIRSSDIIWTYIFGLIFFKQKPSFWTIIGALLILVSISGVCILKYLKMKAKK